MKDKHILLKGVFSAIALVLAISTLHTSSFAHDPSVSMEGFRLVNVEPDASTHSSVVNLLLPYMSGHPESLEGRPTLNLSIKQHEGRLVIDLKMSGYLDDSVAGEHYRGFIAQAPGGWKLVELGVKPSCYRGQATNGRCP